MWQPDLFAELKKTFKDHFIPNSRTFFYPLMFTCCLVGVGCPWVAEQNKRVTILWTEKGLEQISGDPSPPCWLQPPEKSSSCVIGQKWTVGAQGTIRISWGQMENRDLRSVRSAGKKYSSIYLLQNDNRAAPAPRGVRITNMPAKVWRFSSSAAGGKTGADKMRCTFL